MRPAIMSRRGLSPRMRGNRRQHLDHVQGHGSIPAHAGEPSPSARGRPQGRVYPRACGGTTWPLYLTPVLEGLSPRMRGNRAGRVVDQPARGSIPAHAGEPRPPSGRRSRRRVYPRACGGTVSGGERSAAPHGSIPAHAGKPGTLMFHSDLARVYPRACGGTPSDPGGPAIPGGLSPRMRGTSRLVRESSHIKGLSPRMRGNRCWTDGSVYLCGSIPAHAGEPNHAVGNRGSLWVYPRACGGTSGDLLQSTADWGLSPAHAGEPETL